MTQSRASDPKPGLVLATVLALPACIATPFGLVPAARADERMFGSVLTTDTLPRNRWEQQNFLTAGLEKSNGHYELFQLQSGVDYGVTSDVQAGLYLNGHVVDAGRDSIAGRTSGEHVPRNVDPSKDYASARFDSGSFAVKYRLQSPYKDGVGLALSFEPTLGADEAALDYRGIAHVTFLDDTVVWATNIAFRQEWQRVTASTVNVYAPTMPGGPAGWNRASFIEFATGVSVRFTENWFCGFEFRNSNAFAGSFLQQAGSSAFFAGPNLHYGGETMWATLSVLPQLPVAKAYSADQQQVRAQGRIYGDEYERVEVRLALGFQF